jgi:transcriptional regulator NrdR family protein
MDCPVCGSADARVVSSKRVSETARLKSIVSCTTCPVSFEISSLRVFLPEKDLPETQARRKRWAEELRQSVKRGETLARLDG